MGTGNFEVCRVHWKVLRVSAAALYAAKDQ